MQKTCNFWRLMQLCCMPMSIRKNDAMGAIFRKQHTTLARFGTWSCNVPSLQQGSSKQAKQVWDSMAGTQFLVWFDNFYRNVPIPRTPIGTCSCNVPSL